MCIYIYIYIHGREETQQLQGEEAALRARACIIDTFSIICVIINIINAINIMNISITSRYHYYHVFVNSFVRLVAG